MSQLSLKLKKLYEEKKYKEIINIINELDDINLNSGLLNLLGVCKMQHNNSAETLKSAIQDFRKAYLREKKTQVIGLTGGQGTGKSTISNILKIILKEAYKLDTVIFSIDDFYKTLNERKIMSKKISALFLTRGVPGTHDTKMLYRCVKNLKKWKIKGDK